MQKHGRGESGASAILTIVLVLLLVCSLGFAVWAFAGRQDFESNTNKKITAAVTVAEAAQRAQLQTQFNQASESPYKTYTGSNTYYGSVSFNYPKTWSAYVDETSQSEPINGYFYPLQIPGTGTNTAWALRVELLATQYAGVVASYSKQISLKQLSASAYIPPKMVGVSNVQPGIRLDGAIATGQIGSLVILQVRDKTLKVYTESTSFMTDFNNVVLSSLTFLP